MRNTHSSSKNLSARDEGEDIFKEFRRVEDGCSCGFEGFAASDSICHIRCRRCVIVGEDRVFNSLLLCGCGFLSEVSIEYCITCVGRNKITYRGSRLVIPICLHDGCHVGVLVCIVVLLSKSISIETGSVCVGEQGIPYRLIGHVVSDHSPSGRHLAVAVAVAPATLSSGYVGHVLRYYGKLSWQTFSTVW
jgi:hypothetical protein